MPPMSIACIPVIPAHFHDLSVVGRMARTDLLVAAILVSAACQTVPAWLR